MPWNKLYRADTMPLPFIPDRSESLYLHINRTQNRYKWRDSGMDLNLIRCMRAYYYAAISFVDFQIGRILQTLEEMGELDHTLILFSSDHGEYLGDYGCFGKRGMHDVSARVPMIARLPAQFTAGRICSEPVSLVDVLPTVLHAAGQTVDHVDGAALQLIASNECSRDYVLSQWGMSSANSIYMIASKDWKYIYSAGENKEILFDRQADPMESRNAADHPGCSRVKEKLRQALLVYLESTGAADAVELRNGGLQWKKQMPLTQCYLQDNPDAGLLFQDEPESLFEGVDGYRSCWDNPSGRHDKIYWQRMFYGDEK